jgi:CubicO group peptidase (beta-lactamase class C family)
MSPNAFNSAGSPEDHDIDPEKLKKVERHFNRQLEAGRFPGGQLVLRRDGQLIISIALGVARGYRASENRDKVPVNQQTIFPALSAGKPLAATAIALLEDHKEIRIDNPVAHYIPSFERHGKEEITILDVLTHRSGLLMPEFVKDIHSWRDPTAVREALINCTPYYSRGTLAYHPHEYGWILNEIIQEVDGRDLPTFFKQEIATPLNLPALAFGRDGRDIETFAFLYWEGPKELVVAGSNVAKEFEWQNSEEFFNANNPAVSLATNAESIAGFYDFLVSGGITPSGRQLISRQLLHQYTTRCVSGWDRSLRMIVSLGRGFIVGSWFPSSFGWWNTGKCFGHGGGFSSLAFGDYDKHIAVAILTNGNRNLYDMAMRFIPLAHDLRNACRT